MRNVARLWMIAGVFCTLIVVTPGCNRGAQEPVAQANTYQDLPDATNILSALNEKNYEEAVAALIKVKETVSTEQQRQQFSALTLHVQGKLSDASASEPKAQEAMHALGVMVRGR